MPSVLNTRKSPTRSHSGKLRKTNAAARERRLLFEPLEDRRLLATTAHWVGGTGNWSNAANWDIGVVPNNSAGVTYDVILDLPSNPVITLDQNVSIDSLTNTESLIIKQRTANLLSQFENSGTITVDSGANSDGLTARLSLPSGTATNDGTIILQGGILADLFLVGDTTLAGSGSVVMKSEARTAIAASANVTLTIGDTQLLSGAGQVSVLVTNQGVIRGDLNLPTPQVLNFTKAVQSDGVLRASGGGSVTLNAGVISKGDIGVSDSGKLTLKGPVSYSGDLEATLGGTLHVSGVTLDNLGRTIRAAGGTVLLENSTVNGGAIEATDNAASRVHLKGNVRFNGVPWSDPGAGEFHVPPGGNTQLFGDYAKQLPLGYTLIVDSGPNAGGNTARLKLPAGEYRNDGTIELRGGVMADLYLSASTTISGSGDIAMTAEDRQAIAGAAGAILTIGPDQTLRGRGLVQLDTVNYGLIQAGTSGLKLTLENPITNYGEMRTVNGGILVASGIVTNYGVLDAGQEGGDLDINNGVRIHELGVINSRPGGTLRASGSILGTTANRDRYAAATGPVVMDGNGTSAAPKQLEVMSADLGAVPEGFTRNFAYAELTLGATNFVRLVDQSDNAPGTGAEAIYTDVLKVPAGTTLDLNGFKVYTRAFQSGGTILGGTVTKINDGGLIQLNDITPGAISVSGQVDTWTFFGRAGHSILVSVNPALPISPFLNYVRVQLLDPQGVVIASGNNAATGGGSSLRLPEKILAGDGIYSVKVQVDPGHGVSIGNYQVAVWDTTTNTRPLQFNQTSIGHLATPYSLDKWTFSATAGQQVQFDLIDTAGADIGFTLSGPGGWTGFVDSTVDSGLINLPATGEYTLTAENLIFQYGNNYSFRLNATSVTDLELDVPFTGSLAGSNHAQLFRIALDGPSPLLVTLANESLVNRNELYVKLGAPPTRRDFDFNAAGPFADQQIVMPTASAQVWYVLVYAAQVIEPSSFTLLAESPEVAITKLAPARHGDSADAVLTLSGVGFKAGMSVSLIDGNGARYPATNTTTASRTLSTATFAAHSVPPGTYSVVIERPDGAFGLLPQAFTMVDGGRPNLVTSLTLPSALGYHSTATLYMDYRNTGDVAMPAPMLTFTVLQPRVPEDELPPNVPPPPQPECTTVITVYPDGYEEYRTECKPNRFLHAADPDQGYLQWLNYIRDYNADNFRQAALLTLDSSRVKEGLWTSAVPEGFSNSISVLATGQTPGLLQPGESGRIPIYWAGWQKPGDPDYPNFRFFLTETTATDAKPIDWSNFKDRMRPDTTSSEAWEVIWANFREESGDRWGEYVQMLNENAGHLGTQDQRVLSISDLLSLELLQSSGGLNPVRTLAADVDVSLDATGFPLQFTRGFAQSIDSRFRLGPLGRGWRHSWETALEVESDGKVHLTDGQNRLITFQPDVRGGYQTLGGSRAELTKIDGVGYQISTSTSAVWAFHLDGTLNFIEDSFGNRATATYSGGQLTRISHSSGPAIDIDYTPQGRISRVRDSVGRETSFSYDAVGEHLLAVEHFDGTTTTYSYEVNPNSRSLHALRSATREGVTQSYTYDALGRLFSVQGAGQETSAEFSYDLAGTVTVDAALDLPTTLRFDHRGNPTSIQDPLGELTTLHYDAKGQLSSTIDPLGATTSFTYDSIGNLTSALDPLGRTGFTYDAEGRVTSLTDANGNTTSWQRDADGNPTSLTYPDTSAESVTYDSQGNIATTTNRRGQTTTYSYDTQGGLLRKDFSDGTFAAYTYDARGRMATATNYTGTMTFHYDPQDRLEQVDYPASRSIHYDYDDAGRMTRIATGDGHITNYEYDAFGRLSRVLDEASALVVEYTYDSLGRMVREDFGNGGYTLTAYAELDRIASIHTFGAGGVVLSFFEYDYDAAGRRTRVSSHDGVWMYEYDATGQLTHAVLDSSNPAIPDQDLAYEYDALGNRSRTILNGVVTDYVTNALNQYARVGNVDYNYDADGNLVAKIDGSNVSTYDYDGENRLVGISSPAGAWEYEYDALGNRVRVVGGDGDRRLLVDVVGISDVIAEYDDTGALLLAFQLGNGVVGMSSPSTQLYYHYDALGSSIALTATDSGMSSVYSYGPFGELLLANEITDNRFGYVGRHGVMQDGGGLLNMRARFYDSTLGRFTAADPIGFAGGQVNLYSYVANNPLSFLDPSGLATKEQEEWLRDVRLRRKEREAGCNEHHKFVQFVCGCALEIPSPVGFAENIYNYLHDEDLDLGDVCTEEIGDLAACLHEAAREEALMLAWFKAIETCTQPMVPTKDPDRVPWDPLPQSVYEVGSYDPNQKLSSGGGPGGFVMEGRAISYRVDFENDVSATGPAQVVGIRDQLSDDLDWSSFALSDIGFGEVVISIPEGMQSYESVVPSMAGDEAFEVQVSVSLNADSGLLSVWFVTVDPETGLPPDVLTGFLPPEDGTGRGQGHISYTIAPKSGLPTGTEIRNIAQIQFDFGEIITTNQVDPHDPTKGTDPAKEALITIDAGAPTSSVNPLPSTSTSQTFDLSWQGADDNLGSGMRHYDVFASVDGGPFELLIGGVTTNLARIPVEVGRSYAFYSIATDNVGHVEAPPTAPDAVITIVAPLTLDAGDDQTIAEGSVRSLAGASFTYPGDPGLLSGTVDWGDGTSDALAIVPGGGGGTFANTHTYGDDGLYTVTFSLSDGVGAPVQGTAATIVTNVLPQTAASGNSQVDEGTVFLFTLGPIVDPGSDFVTMYRIVWGDGEVQSIAATDLPADRILSHTYADGPADRVIQIGLTDEDGVYPSVATHTLRVENVDPTMTIAGDDEVAEGAEYVLTLGHVVDPGADVVSEYLIHWGDGQTQVVGASDVPADRKLRHTYADGDAPVQITVDVTDDDGTFVGIASKSVQVRNVVPTLGLLGGASVFEGSSNALTLGLIVDPGQDTVVAYLIDWGDGHTESIAAGGLPPDRKLIHTYTDGDAQFTIAVHVTDEDGTHLDVASKEVDVLNAPPSVAAQDSHVEVVEGQTAQNVLMASDPGDDDITLSASVGMVQDNLDGTWSWAWIASDGPDQTQTVTITAIDSDGASASTTFQLSVLNVAPSAHDAVFSVVENTAAGTSIGFVTASDPGADTLHYLIVGGTGATAFAIHPTTGELTVVDASQLDFETTTSFSIHVQVTDDDNAAATAAVTINLLNQPSISGAVIIDANLNGRFDANESGIDGVIIELLDEFGGPILDASGQAVRITTSQGGLFLFEDLAPGDYRIHEIQPSGVTDGPEILGSLGGTIPANDTMQIALERTDAYDYVFTEIASLQQLARGDTAGIGFWQNKNGQDLIRQGGAALATWLTANFGNVFGNTFVGATGDAVATFYRDQLFKQKAKKSAGPAKVDAQFMAVALATYFTSRALAGDVAGAYGFNVTETGTGVKSVSVGSKGAAFGVANNSDASILQLLMATNSLTDTPDSQLGFASIYDRNGDGIIDASEAELRSQANELYSWINEQGGI